MKYQYSLMIWERVSVQTHVPGKKNQTKTKKTPEKNPKQNKNPQTTKKQPSNELQGNNRAGVDV